MAVTNRLPIPKAADACATSSRESGNRANHNKFLTDRWLFVARCRRLVDLSAIERWLAAAHFRLTPPPVSYFAIPPSLGTILRKSNMPRLWTSLWQSLWFHGGAPRHHRSVPAVALLRRLWWKAGIR